MRIGAAVGPWWALAGFAAMMLEAIIRLSGHALHALQDPDLPTLLAYVFCVLGMVYAEGYRGFQQRFSPRFAERAHRIRTEPTLARVHPISLFDDLLGQPGPCCLYMVED